MGDFVSRHARDLFGCVAGPGFGSDRSDGVFGRYGDFHSEFLTKSKIVNLSISSSGRACHAWACAASAQRCSIT